MKLCTNCNTTQPLSEFNRAKGNKDGLHKHCRTCRKAEKKAKRQELKSNPVAIPLSKVCSRCNMEKAGTMFARDAGSHSGIAGWCKQCENEHRREQRKADPVTYKMKIMLSCAKGRAKAEKLPFDLTHEWLMEVFGHITHCPVLGIPLVWDADSNGPTPSSPSLDEIVLGRGYVKSNVQLMSHKANAMKSDASDGELLAFCEYHVRRIENAQAGAS